MWLSDVRCVETVKAAWTNTMGPNIDSVILRNVAKCEKDLTWWNHNYFVNVRRDLEAKKRSLLSVEEEAMVSGNNSLV